MEEKLNKNNITSFLKGMDKSLLNLTNTTNDYALWDDTFNFILNRDPEYIYENFRNGSNTLEALEISSLSILDKDDKHIYSNYNSNEQYFKNTKGFEEFITQELKDKSLFSGVLSYKFTPFYVVKSQVLKSDKKSESVGYVITTKLLDSEQILDDNSHLFKSIGFKQFKQINKKIEFETSFSKLKNIKVSYQLNQGKIINNINFYDLKNNYLFSIIIENKDIVLSDGKSIIVIFNFIGSLILLIIFIVTFQNQRLILNQNRVLNKKIIKRTKQLNKAYKNLKSKNRALFKLANMDYLTNINNRASFFSKSIELLKESNRSYSNFAIMIIDIDFFKTINDKYSHAAGDKVLIKFTQTVNSILDEDMVFGRIGGEEFCVTVFDKTPEYVTTLSEAIREKCSQTPVFADSNKINFTVSIGIAFKENSNQNIDQILHKADILLYKAKESGRNKVIRDV